MNNSRTLARQMARQMVNGITAREIVVGPPLWHVEGGGYFVVAVERAGHFHCDLVKSANASVDLCEVRERLIGQLGHAEGVRVVEVDDELETARTCEALWPCEATRRIRTRIEMEVAALKAHAEIGRRH